MFHTSTYDAISNTAQFETFHEMKMLNPEYRFDQRKIRDNRGCIIGAYAHTSTGWRMTIWANRFGEKQS